MTRPFRRHQRVVAVFLYLLTSIDAFVSDMQHGRKQITSCLFSTPPMERQTQQKVIYGVTSRDGPLNESVQRVAGLSSFEEGTKLIEIGAVWARMDGLSEEDLLDQYDGSDELGGRAMYADIDVEETTDLEEYIEKMNAQRFRRILTPSFLPAGTDLRIYPTPRRFPYTMTKENLLYEDTTFVVVDKPPMLPTQPDASNYYECCPGEAHRALGPFVDILNNEIARPLLCHRVDACVGGCVVMAKDRNGQAVFQQYQRDRALRKVYLAVTKEPVQEGMHVQWMWAPQSQRKSSGGPPCQLIRKTPPESRRKARDYWNRCVLQVVKNEPITVRGEECYQVTIRLVTGRKHQVRAQLASLGSPIWGDTLYGPLAGRSLDELESDNELDLDEAISQCRVPTEPIGLQAHAIMFGGIRVKAHPPWWIQEQQSATT